jgi:lipopolysaccharide export system protein LptA
MSGQFFSRVKEKRSVFTYIMASCLVGSLFLTISIAQEKLIETKGPTTITASTLTADNKARTALFEGSVVAKNDAITIQSDRMLVHYAEAGKVTKIEATGHVKVIKGERIITSDDATYFADEEKVIFTGHPRAMEGGNVVSGTKMIYLVKEDRSIVENSKVFIENRKSR